MVAIKGVQESSIINYAKNSVTEYDAGRKKEEGILQEYADKITEKIPGGGNSETVAVPGKIVTGSNAVYTETVDGKTLIAKIPVGFCVVKDIEGDANTISRGLVISDKAEDDLANSKGGNQFVWIPVEDYSKFHLIGGYSEGRVIDLADTKLDPGIFEEAGDASVAGSPLEKNNVLGTTESIAMYNSVKDNKGFYIARFEAGVSEKDSEGNPIDNYQLTTKILTDGTVKPLSQKGIGVWNDIAWGGIQADIASDGLPGNDNVDGVVKVARSMYTKNSICGVTSTLCYGVQWDAVMNYIDPNYYKQDGTLTSFVANSKYRGNYSERLALTGQYEQNHMFDLAGNVEELTMESYGRQFRVCRGSWYGSNGSWEPASMRGCLRTRE